MPEILKSKLGFLLGGALLLTVFFCLVYDHLIGGPSVWPLIISIVLTFPWYFLFFYILIPMALGGGEAVGRFTTQDFRVMMIVSMTISALINSFILYLVGFLLTKVFRYFVPKRNL